MSRTKIRKLVEYTRLPRTLKKAKKLGLNKYFDGKRCKKGHLAAKYVRNKGCIECDSHRNRDRKRNAASVRNYNRSDRAKAASKKWRAAHPRRYWAIRACRAAKTRAKERGIPFKLTRQYVESIMPDKCPVFGVPFDYSKTAENRDNAPSLDRIIPDLGYTEGNVVVISMRANQIKNKYRSRDIYKVAIWLKKLGL